MTATNRQACAMLLLLLAAASLGLAAAGSEKAEYDCSITLESRALTCTRDADAASCTVTLPDALAPDAPDAKYVTCVLALNGGGGGQMPFASFASLLEATSTPIEPVAAACATAFSSEECFSAVLSQVRTTTAKAKKVLTLAFEPVFVPENPFLEVFVACAQQSSKKDVCVVGRPSLVFFTLTE